MVYAKQGKRRVKRGLNEGWKSGKTVENMQKERGKKRETKEGGKEQRTVRRERI